MTTLRDTTKNAIVEIAVETQDVLPDAPDWKIMECVEDCIGRRLNDFEERLVMVAYETDADTAKASIWYKWLA